jgi:aspartate/methionine/tyrosine aminotransferase
MQPNPLTQLIQQKRASGVPILDLTESNPTRAGIAYPPLILPEALIYDPNPAGLLSARQAVSTYYGGRVSTDRILLTASTSEAYGFLFKLLTDPGDEVLVPRPSYPLFEFLAELECVKVVQYPLIYDHGWMIDFEALETSIGPKTRSIILVNPNNPTGSYLKKQELERLLGLCRKHGLAILSDEVFADFAFDPDPRRVSTLVATVDVLSFALSGLSKVSGMPQMKLGWIVVSGPAEQRTEAYSRLELIADTYLSVGTPVQLAAGNLIEARHEVQKQIRMRTSKNLALLRARLQSTAFGLLDVEGGWYAILQAPKIRTEEEWVLELLRRENVLVQPGFFYDFDREAFLVLSLLTPENVFEEGLARLLALV